MQQLILTGNVATASLKSYTAKERQLSKLKESCNFFHKKNCRSSQQESLSKRERLFLSAFRLATIIQKPAASFSTLKRKKPILNTTLRSSQQGQVMFLLQKKLQSLQKPLAIRFAESMMWESPVSIASSIA